MTRIFDRIFIFLSVALRLKTPHFNQILIQFCYNNGVIKHRMTGQNMAMQEQDKTVAKQEKHEGEIAKLVEEIRNYRSEIEQLSSLVNLARENLEELLLDRG